MKKRHSLLAPLLALSLLAPTLGQTPQAAPAPQSPAPTPQESDEDVVRITSNLVQFDVTVTDKKGRIVTDLKPEDFEVSVNGKRQPITNFSFITTEPDAASEGRGGETKQPKGQGAVPPPSRLRPEQVRRTIALVADDLCLSFESVFYVRKALKKFIDEQMQPGDLVALVRTSAGMGALQQFTSDKRILYRAIERVRYTLRPCSSPNSFGLVSEGERLSGRSRTGVGGDAETPAVEVVRRAGLDIADEFRDQLYTVGTLGAINFVIRAMRELPGRKSVVLLSDGFPLGGKDIGSSQVYENTRRLVDLANRASVVIYTIDTRGLTNPDFIGADVDVSPEMTDSVRARQYAADVASRSGPSLLSEGTGGFSVVNSNDIGRGIRRVLEDQRGYYLVGFRPDESAFDRVRGRVRFNKVEVRVARPGCRVRTRVGFYGFTEENARPVLRTRGEQMIAALNSPFASGAIPLRLTSLFVKEPEKDAAIASMLHIAMDGFKFTEEADGWRRAVLDVAALTFGEDGQIVDQVNRTETIRARAESYDKLMRDGLLYSVNVPVKKPGAYQLRVVVRDAGTEQVGSAGQFIEVPDLKRDRLALSGIILEGAGVFARRDTAGASLAEGRADAPDPSGSPVVRRFRPGERLQYFFDIYNPKPERTGGRPRLTAQARLFRDGRAVFAGAAQPFEPATIFGAKHMRAGFNFQLGADLQPGEYVLQVVVTDELADNKHAVAAQWIDFEIIK
jgi:VWFA-related protein